MDSQRWKSVQQHQPGLVGQTIASGETISDPGLAYVQGLRLKEHQKQVKAAFALVFGGFFCKLNFQQNSMFTSHIIGNNVSTQNLLWVCGLNCYTF